MKIRIAFSLIILALASTLVGGATLALFTDLATTEAVVFTTGTVEITGGGVNIQPAGESGDKTVVWCVTNSGSKAAYIRVKARGGTTTVQGESAGGEGTPYAKPRWAMWFPYTLNSGETKVKLLAGDKIEVGSVTVNNDAQNLYVQYNTTNGWTLTETHVYAEEKEPASAAAGKFTDKKENLGNITSVLHTIPLSLYTGNTLYLVTHAAVEKGPAKWTLCLGSPWIASGGWWYYSTRVASGETVCISLNVSTYEASVEYYLDAEAVQTSNNAAHTRWPGNPY